MYAWARHGDVRGGKDFETVKSAITEVAGMGLETCATLGMLTADQAIEQEAGVYTYNHSLNASAEFIPK